LPRYTEIEREKLIKGISRDNRILKTPLADFMPVDEDDKAAVDLFAQKLLSSCNHTSAPHEVIVASLVSACSTSYPSKLLH
jgi:hypothetical protein